MSKYSSDAVLDAGLDLVATCTKLTICEGQPTDYADATTLKGSGGKMLAEFTIDGSDFTKANDTSGRKSTVGAQAGATAGATGSGDHVALVTGSALHYVTTSPSQSITATGTVDCAAWDINIQDPA